ncbi:Pancreatic lipase-related protein 2-like protein, partial [Dinothrombium tinctorium]
MSSQSVLVVLILLYVQIFSSFAEINSENHTGVEDDETSNGEIENVQEHNSSPTTTVGVDWSFIPTSNESVFDDFSFNFFDTKKDDSTCYGVLGCFENDAFSDPILGPITLAPQNIANTYFDPKKLTKFLIHGFQDSFGDMTYMGDIKDQFMILNPEEYNVFGVDWSKGAKTIDYLQAIENARVVGAATAHFIKKLNEFTNMKFKKVHLIGHSLGAHVCGFAGKKLIELLRIVQKVLPSKIGQIKALDPAGPGFQLNDSKSRLAPTDASYVIVIHTDAGNSLVEGLGIEDALGDDDFYANGGSHQPGCSVTKGVYNILKNGIISGISDTVNCNHHRSYKLFLVNPCTLSECQFVGYECKNYDDFQAGKCGECGSNNSKCAIFGFLGQSDPVYGKFWLQQEARAKSSNKTRKLYFKTSASTPFCLFHYQIKIRFDPSMSRSATGSIKMNLRGSKRNVNDVEMKAFLLESITSFEPGHNYTKLFTSKKSLGSVDGITLTWQFGGAQILDPTKLFNFPKLKITNIEVKYMSNIDPEVRSKYSTILCPISNEKIESGKQASFER